MIPPVAPENTGRIRLSSGRSLQEAHNDWVPRRSNYYQTIGKCICFLTSGCHETQYLSAFPQSVSVYIFRGDEMYIC